MASKYEQGQDAQYQREMFRIARGLMALNAIMEEELMNGIIIKELRLQGPLHTGQGYRVIVKGRNEQGDPFVGFRSGETVQDVLAQVSSGVADGSLQLKPEKPWDGPAR